MFSNFFEVSLGFFSILNILRTSDTFKKLRVQLSSYTKYCLPAKNKEYLMISN